MKTKTAVITGGSSGIGLEMAKQLARQNYNIILIARNKEKLEHARQQIPKTQAKILTVQADITSDQDLTKAAQLIETYFGTIDMLILSAGVVNVQTVDGYHNTDDFLSDVRVNLEGTMLTVFYLQKLLNTGAKVIFISSGFGLMGAAGYTSYCASKAGIINFAEAWRREVLHRKIKIYVATPADVDTPMLRKELEDQPDWMKQQASPRKALPAEVVARRILKRAKGDKFLIFPSSDVYLLYIVKKLLPMRASQWLLDKLFPRPHK